MLRSWEGKVTEGSFCGGGHFDLKTAAEKRFSCWAGDAGGSVNPARCSAVCREGICPNPE